MLMEGSMSNENNPFQGPQTTVIPERSLQTQGGITDTMLVHLRGASPWLRFIGILGFIGAGLTALWGLGLLLAFPFMGSVWGDAFGLDNFNQMGALFGALMGIFVIGGGAMVFFPALFAYRFGDNIRSYIRTGTDANLETAFKNNKSFWKFYGIVCIVYLALIPLIFVITIVGVIITAL